MSDFNETKTVDTLVEELKKETEGGAVQDQEPIEETSAADNFDKPVPEDEQPKGEDPVEIEQSAKKSAGRYVRMLNSLMKLIFKPLYRKTILQEGDIDKMKAFNNRNAGKGPKQMEEALHSESEMWPVANRFEEYMKAVEEIPLDDEEKEMLAEPLAEVLNKYKNARLSPEWSLVLTAGMILLPRLTPIIPDLTKIFKSEK